MSQPTRKTRSRKAADRPKKPYAEYPLSPHSSGKWQKKIRGKIHYFGNWAKRVNGQLVRVEGDGWKEALELYKAQADDLHAGRTPRVNSDQLNLAQLCNQFLTAKLRKLESGEISKRTFQEYRETTDMLIAAFGANRLVEDLAAEDFGKLRGDMAKRWGPVRLGNLIGRIKSVFKFGLDNGLIDKAIRFGSEFRKPGRAVLRRHKAQNGLKMLEADELRQLIDAADVQMRAMILLGVNSGLGNHDVASLPLAALDLEKGIIDYPRPKTGIERRCPLWPETIAAVRQAIAQRPEPQHEEAANLVFINSRGSQWTRSTEKSRIDNVSIQFKLMLRRVGLYRQGLGFYTLRHVFRTVADAARDAVACDIIMGHSDPSMGGHYRERVEDSRLRAVAEHVRQWLFGKPPDDEGTEPETSDSPTPPKEGGSNDRPTLRLFAG
jgi:integrase